MSEPSPFREQRCVRCGRITGLRGGRVPRFCAVCGQEFPDVQSVSARVRRLKTAPPAATAALMLGICSLLPMIGLPLGIVAIVLGRTASRQILDSRGLLGGRSMATAGALLGLIGIVLSLATLLRVL